MDQEQWWEWHHRQHGGNVSSNIHVIKRINNILKLFLRVVAQRSDYVQADIKSVSRFHTYSEKLTAHYIRPH